MSKYRIVQAYCQAWVPSDGDWILDHRCKNLVKEIADGEQVLCMDHAVELQTKGKLRIIVRENN